MGSRYQARLLVVSVLSLILTGLRIGSEQLLLHSLKNHGVDREVDEMFEMGAETMRLPMDEKMKFEQGDDGGSFG